MRHRWLKYSNVYINHDPVMTLTKFMARSTWVACASELGKLLKCHLKEKANRKLANGQNIEDSEKRKWPKGLSAPALELNTIIFKHVYWYMQLISGERLQDHWSSGISAYACCWFPYVAAHTLTLQILLICSRWLAPLLLLLDLYEKVSVISQRKAEAEKSLVRFCCRLIVRFKCLYSLLTKLYHGVQIDYTDMISKVL